MTTAPEPRPEPRRLRAVDVIDQLQATIQRLTERHTPASPSAAVDFTRNAKGETQIGVKVTVNMDADREALAAFLLDVYNQAQAIYERATMRYPTSTGTVTNDPPPRQPA
jgi:hypothetical protein